MLQIFGAEWSKLEEEGGSLSSERTSIRPRLFISEWQPRAGTILKED